MGVLTTTLAVVILMTSSVRASTTGDWGPAHGAPNLVAWHLIGGSGTDPQTRFVGWSFRQRGWERYVRFYVVPQLHAGIRRILLHNPFGMEARGPMAFDQYLHARQAGTNWLIDHFVAAWQPVIRGDYTHGQPVEVICYLGDIDGSPDMVAAQDDADQSKWLIRATASVSLPLRAGMSLAFDSANDLACDSRGHRFIQLMASLGVPIYIESRPYANRPYLFGYNVISTYQFWQRSDPQRHPRDSGKWAARNDQMTGEVLLIIREDQLPESTSLSQAIGDILDNGWTPCVAIPRNFLKEGDRLKQLITPAN